MGQSDTEQEQPKKRVPYAVRQMHLERAEKERLRAIIDAIGEHIDFHGCLDMLPEHIRLLRRDRDQAQRDAMKLWNLRSPGSVSDGDLCMRVESYRKAMDDA